VELRSCAYLHNYSFSANDPLQARSLAITSLAVLCSRKTTSFPWSNTCREPCPVGVGLMCFTGLSKASIAQQETA